MDRLDDHEQISNEFEYIDGSARRRASTLILLPVLRTFLGDNYDTSSETIDFGNCKIEITREYHGTRPKEIIRSESFRKEAAIDDPNKVVKLNATTATGVTFENGKEGNVIIGAYAGSHKEGDKIVGDQYVNTDQAKAIEKEVAQLLAYLCYMRY